MASTPAVAGPPLADRGGPTTKVRLRFAKRGDLRLVSHHDLMRCLERLLRRADLPIAHSQGFNPRPKAVFASALGLGIEGLHESLELELAEPLDAETVRQRLAACAPPGFEFLSAEAVGPGRAARAVAAHYVLPVPPERWEVARAAVAAVLASESWPYLRRRPDRTVEADLRPSLLDATLGDDGRLRFRVQIDPGGSARPEEILEAMGLRDLLDSGAHLIRADLELATAAVPRGAPPTSRPAPTPPVGPEPDADLTAAPSPETDAPRPDAAD